MKNIFPFLILLLCSCKKTLPAEAPVIVTVLPTAAESSYVKYTISAGAHFSDKSVLREITLTEMNFKVKFDSSAIYKTIDPLNQYDINKLYGFSDGNDHHQNSARIGWSWNDNALRLYAYTYYNGVRDSKEITSVNIGAEVLCTIKFSAAEYVFKSGNSTVTMPRFVTTTIVKGYQLYPYFGGDETAPAEIRILIQDLP